MRNRDVRGLIVAWALTGMSAGAWGVAAASPEHSLLDLPWLTITGAALAAMASSLMKTTFTVLKAAKVGAGDLSVWRLLVADALLALVAGMATYAVLFGMSVRNPYLLLASMLVVGWVGEPLAGRLLRAAGDRLASIVEGGKPDKS